MNGPGGRHKVRTYTGEGGTERGEVGLRSGHSLGRRVARSWGKEGRLEVRTLTGEEAGYGECGDSGQDIRGQARRLTVS